jgi:putative tryptophan/tyrosine transport system substrate-binding protein
MIRRREFITLLGGAAVGWPLVARAQQAAPPTIGLLDPRSPGTVEDLLRAFRQGLKDTGYVEGENVTIAYRFAEGQFDRLPELAVELVRRRVSMIAATAIAAASAAKAATETMPIVSILAEDPVRRGLVSSLARPGGNLTGINFLTLELVAKRLEILRELVPALIRLAVLVNPANAASTETMLGGLEPAASAMGLQIQVLNASTGSEIHAAFATFVRERPDALFVNLDPFFTSRRVQLATLATRHGIPMTSGNRQITEAGGLMSYGASTTDAWRQAGVYSGLVLKGAKPADLPFVQASKFELVINAETARMLGLTVPPSLLALADEVIE